MGTLVIGSTAMEAYLPGRRKPADLDVYSNCLVSEMNDEIRVDAFWHPTFEDWVPPREATRCATLDELYTIKVSHSSWELKNGSWLKHMSDIVALKDAGATLDLDLYKRLYPVWEEIHGKKKVTLTQDKESFFTDAVNRIYDHDSIHYSVAYGDAPIYESMYVDGEEIAMDMAKIRALPLEDCLRLYREEIYATALERWVIPSGYKISPHKAYAWACRKTITSLTKGWSSRFLIENYKLIRDPDTDYVARHLSRKHLLIPLEK